MYYLYVFEALFYYNILLKKKVYGICTYLAKFYNGYKCISGDIGIDKNNTHSK